MVNNFNQYLDSLEGKMVAIHFNGLISGVKHFENFAYGETDDYYILGSAYEEDYLWVSKHMISNLEFSVFSADIISDNTRLTFEIA